MYILKQLIKNKTNRAGSVGTWENIFVSASLQTLKKTAIQKSKEEPKSAFEIFKQTSVAYIVNGKDHLAKAKK